MFPWLHPSMVHFAVALLFAALLLDVLGLWRQSERLLFAGYWNTLLGAGAALVALASGLWAERHLGVHSPLGNALLGFHKIFAVTGALLAVALAGARIAMKGYIRPRVRTLYLAAAFAMAAFVVITGAIGGGLVYAYGLGIGPATAQRVIDAHKALQPAPPAAPPPEAQIAPAPPPSVITTETPPGPKAKLPKPRAEAH